MAHVESHACTASLVEEVKNIADSNWALVKSNQEMAQANREMAASMRMMASSVSMLVKSQLALSGKKAEASEEEETMDVDGN